MNNLIQNKDGGVSITLKEITDLVSVEHNKAMKQVEKLSLESSFGGVEKIATPTYNPNGTFNRNIETYKLTKKQAIAVGAKLNNTLLMKVIDRLEELETEKNKPMTQLDMIIASAQEVARIEKIQQSQEARIEYLEDSKVINSRQRHALKKAVSKKAYTLKETHSLSDDFIKKGHMRLWKLLKDRYLISSYFDIPTVKFEESINIINSATIEDII